MNTYVEQPFSVDRVFGICPYLYRPDSVVRLTYPRGNTILSCNERDFTRDKWEE